MIVVTAPTGQIGAKVVTDLLDAAADLRLIAREPDKLPVEVRSRVELIVGSHGDPDVIDRAFTGADAVFWLPPPDSSRTMDAAYAEFTRPAVEAIRRHCVGHVVSITALGRGTAWADRAGLVTASIQMDDLLMGSGAAFRGLAMPSFMENVLRQIGPMKEKGLFFGPIEPDRKLPWTATQDMAAAAVRLLSDLSWSGRKETPVIGPDELSFDQIAAIITELVGCEIKYQQIGWADFKQQFLARGATESFAQGYVDMYRAKDEGMDNAAALGVAVRAPTSFHRFCRDYVKPAFDNRND